MKKNILFLTLFAVAFCDAKNILGVFIAPSPSHFITPVILMRGLLEKGYNVTVVTTHAPLNISEPSESYREIFIENHAGAELMKQAMKHTKGAAFFINLLHMLKASAERSEKILNHTKMLEFLNDKNEHFDLMIYGWFANDVALGLAGHFHCPSIILSPQPHLKMLRDFVGNPPQASTVPIYMTTGEPMNFVERVKHFLFYAGEYFFVLWYDAFILQPVYDRVFPESQGYPSLTELKKNVSLVLVNHHFSLGGIRPLLPNLVEISGIQAKEYPDPLPYSIEKFLNDATDGAILFSLGSNVKSNSIKPEVFQLFLRVFSRQKQKILWKWDDLSVDNVPKNIMLIDWLPQDDVLAHHNIRLFISHCGKGSINEAKFHGVPILAMPLFADQESNAASVANEGWGKVLNFYELTEELLEESLHEMLSTFNYAKRVKHLSSIYRDRPMRPVETALYWIEYVLRYDGAKHMQSQAVNLNFFQLYSIDVIAFIATALLIGYKIIVYLIKYLLKAIKTKKLKQL